MVVSEIGVIARADFSCPYLSLCFSHPSGASPKLNENGLVGRYDVLLDNFTPVGPDLIIDTSLTHSHTHPALSLLLSLTHTHPDRVTNSECQQYVINKILVEQSIGD